MNRNVKIGVILGTLIIMSLVVWLLLPDDNNGEKSQGKIYSSNNWDESYGINSKEPLGLHLFKELLSAKIGVNNSIQLINDIDSIKLVQGNPEDLVMIGVAETFSINHQDSKSLKKIVESGATLFVSSNSVNSSFSSRFLDDLVYSFDYSDKIALTTPDDTLQFYNVYQEDTVGKMWMVFDGSSIDESVEILSLVSNEPNFIHYKLGRGHVYIHTNPELFCNYQLLTENGFANSYYTINKINPQHHILFLAGGQSYTVAETQTERSQQNQGGNRNQRDDSNLRYILESKGGTMALLLSVLAIILFVIFRSKRKRPVVPYIGEQKDMTLAFAETITSIYISKKNPYGILQLMRRNFFDTIQKHFFIDLSRRGGDREVISLSEKSNVPVEKIIALLNRLEANPSDAQKDKFIHETQKYQHDFYKSAGILSEKLIESIKRKEITVSRSLILSSALLILGILIILFGLNLLTQANGIGVLLWPIGGFLVLLGILRLSFPLLKVSGKEIAYYGILGRKMKFESSEIVEVNKAPTVIGLKLTNNRQININLWNLDAHDKAQVEQLVSSIQVNQYE